MSKGENNMTYKLLPDVFYCVESVEIIENNVPRKELQARLTKNSKEELYTTSNCQLGGVLAIDALVNKSLQNITDIVADVQSQLPNADSNLIKEFLDELVEFGWLG